MSFIRHFAHLHRHYGRVFILNLTEKRDKERVIGEEYYKLYSLLVQMSKQNENSPHSVHERYFMWFDYHEQSRLVRNISPDQFVRKMLIENIQYSIDKELKRLSVFTNMDGTVNSIQQGIFRVNCIDCLDRTNNVQLAMGLYILAMQLESLQKQTNLYHISDRLRDMWINNGDHISRIYTGTGALGQKSKVRIWMTHAVNTTYL